MKKRAGKICSIVMVGVLGILSVFPAENLSHRADGDTVSAAERVEAAGLNVAYHSKEEVIAYLEDSQLDLDWIEFSYNHGTEFDEMPSATAPYSLGKISEYNMESALKTLNSVRYIAGLDDNVQVSDTYNEYAQAAALVNAANKALSHYPTQPADMDDELFSKGETGAGQSNLGYASWAASIDYEIVQGWMADSTSSNPETVGHRRWVLNPAMLSTGFGEAVAEGGSHYYAMYAFDRTGSSNAYGVCWPAQTMPLEYFDDETPWSISMGTTVEESAVEVELCRMSDNQSWKFSSTEADGLFYVNNQGYGQTGCIIFRPENISYQSDDVFQVTITGLSTDVSYQVEFFSLENDSTSATPEPSDNIYPIATKTPSGTTTEPPTDIADVTEEPTPTTPANVTEEPTSTIPADVTEEPTPTNSANVTEEPIPTTPADVTEEPTPTSSANVTEEPTPTSSANVTEEPQPTDAANVTNEPGPTNTAMVTNTPVPVNTPTVTQQPSPTSSTPADISSALKTPAKAVIKSAKNKKGKKIAITVKAQSNISGYQVQYSTKSNMAGAKSKTSTKRQIVLTGLKKKKTYYIRVRAYTNVSGEKETGKWSTKVKVKVKK